MDKNAVTQSVSLTPSDIERLLEGSGVAGVWPGGKASQWTLEFFSDGDVLTPMVILDVPSQGTVEAVVDNIMFFGETDNVLVSSFRAQNPAILAYTELEAALPRITRGSAVLCRRTKAYLLEPIPAVPASAV